MKNTIVFLVLSVLLVSSGGAVYYLYGYKDGFWITATGYGLVIFGWMFLLFLLVGAHYRIRETKLSTAGAGRRLANAGWFLLYPVWLVALVAGFVWLEHLKDARVETILSTAETRETTASVIAIEERRIKSTSHTYAVIIYSTPGEKIRQAIRDDHGLYKTGQVLRVRYSLAYPDMFKVLPPVPE